MRTSVNRIATCRSARSLGGPKEKQFRANDPLLQRHHPPTRTCGYRFQRRRLALRPLPWPTRHVPPSQLLVPGLTALAPLKTASKLRLLCRLESRVQLRVPAAAAHPTAQPWPFVTNENAFDTQANRATCTLEVSYFSSPAQLITNLEPIPERGSRLGACRYWPKKRKYSR